MTIDFFNAELVESYLNKQLTAEETLRFEQNLKDDPEFSEFVSLYQDVDEAISEQDVMELRNSLNSIHEVASEEWISEAPMILTDSFEKELFDAVGEEDVMNLRATLSEIHDLNQEELYGNDELSEIASLDMNELVSLVEDDEEYDSSDYLLDNEIDLAIAEEDVMGLRNMLGSIAKQVAAPPQKMPFYKRISRLAAAASILLIVSVGAASWFSFSSSVMNPEKVVSQCYEPIAPESQKRGGDVQDAARVKREAHDKYRDGDYLGALDEFKDLQLNYPEFRNDNEIISYIGSCYFATGQYDKAIKQFKTVFDDKTSALVDRAEWYLAGCYLRNDDLIDDAMEIYQRIARTPDHEYYEDNRKLLKKLKK